MTQFLIYAGAFILVLVSVITIHESVSYTHLDVYKRQALAGSVRRAVRH